MADLMPTSETIRLMAPILGPIVSALIVASSAIWVGKMVTARLGHIQLLNQFNDRFHTIVEKMHKLDQCYEKDNENKPNFSAEARELYRQFFALMADQLFAFQQNILFESMLVDWLIWRVYAYKKIPGNYPFIVAGMTYKDAWDSWSSRPAVAGHAIVGFLQAIHKADLKNTNDIAIIKKDVKKIVRKFKRKY